MGDRVQAVVGCARLGGSAVEVTPLRSATSSSCSMTKRAGLHCAHGSIGFNHSREKGVDSEDGSCKYY